MSGRRKNMRGVCHGSKSCCISSLFLWQRACHWKLVFSFTWRPQSLRSLRTASWRQHLGNIMGVPSLFSPSLLSPSLTLTHSRRRHVRTVVQTGCMNKNFWKQWRQLTLHFENKIKYLWMCLFYKHLDIEYLSCRLCSCSFVRFLFSFCSESSEEQKTFCVDSHTLCQMLLPGSCESRQFDQFIITSIMFNVNDIYIFFKVRDTDSVWDIV